MAQISKIVDKTEVNASEVFIYTINAAYSGLTIPNQTGEIIEFFPDKIKYLLPPVGGQIEGITEESVLGGTKVTFHLGNVNSGTSLSFTVACYFGPGRVDHDRYTNHVELVANGEVIEEATAPTVNLTLDEQFVLNKYIKPSNVVNAGDEVTFILTLLNMGDFGAGITDVVVTDVLPPQLTPVTTFTPIGRDNSYADYGDPTANELKGSWNDDTMTFHIPKYHGIRYEITFKARVSEDVVIAETFKNIGRWTMNGSTRNDAPLTISIYDPDAAGFELLKYGTRTTIIGAPVEYRLNNSNIGNVPLSNYELEDVMPPEVDTTAFYVSASIGLLNYSIYIALASNSSEYIPIVTDIENGSCPYTDLSQFIPNGDRLAKIKLTSQTLSVEYSNHTLYILGTTNDTAIMGGSYTNEAVATVGNISQTKSWITYVNGESDLNVQKSFIPMKEAYYPLDEFNVRLLGTSPNTICIDPILADLMPRELHYVEDSEYFLYYETATGTTYDSRESGFPIPLAQRENLPNYADTENTLLRWSFTDFILPTNCYLHVIFKVVVELNRPGSFVNKGYMGNKGDNVYAVYSSVIDTLDIDGDGLTTDRISCDEVSGIILSTSEFSLEKLVKGQNDLAYSKSGVTVQGGEVDYRLQVTNNQPMDLNNIELIDILPYLGDTGVILEEQERGSQFGVYPTSMVSATITNVIGEPVDPDPDIVIEYSISNDPKRFDQLGNPIGTGEWSLIPPTDITTVRSIKVTSGASLNLHPYERLIIDCKAKVPFDAPVGKVAYNSYAVRANKITSSGDEPLLPTEPNKVKITIVENERSSIGGFVWLDSNENGLYEEGEEGVNGVTVELYDDYGNLLNTTVTANDLSGNPGYYLFTDLAEGIYQVKFIPYGDYVLTKQSTQPNGSKADQSTGLTGFITISDKEHMLDVDAGVYNDESQEDLRQQAITDMIESVALEQTALSHILNAEGEKIQKAIELDLSLEEMLRINHSVEDMVNSVARLEIVLQEKLVLFKDVLCDLGECLDI